MLRAGPRSPSVVVREANDDVAQEEASLRAIADIFPDSDERTAAGGPYMHVL